MIIKPYSPNNTALKVNMMISCNEDGKNVNLPKTQLKFETTSRDPKLAFAFLKIDPSKAEFCTGNNLNINVRAKENRRGR